MTSDLKGYCRKPYHKFTDNVTYAAIALKSNLQLLVTQAAVLTFFSGTVLMEQGAAALRNPICPHSSLAPCGPQMQCQDGCIVQCLRRLSLVLVVHFLMSILHTFNIEYDVF